jgi:hypothetical protein
MASSYGDSGGYLEWLDPHAPPRAGQTSVAPISVQPPTPNPQGVIGLTPGFTPNYAALIQNDPSYLAYKNTGQLDINQAAARRQAALKALAIQYGGLGGGFRDAYGDIDAPTLDMAKGNQFSDTSRLARNYEQGVEAYKRSLAARHGLQSGELGWGIGQADYARGASEYDLGQEFARAAQTVINDYLGVESRVRSGEADAISAAEANVYANPANRPSQGAEAKLVPDWQSKYGQPVWQGSDGKLYILGPDGEPVTFTPATRGTWSEDILPAVQSGRRVAV